MLAHAPHVPPYTVAGGPKSLLFSGVRENPGDGRVAGIDGGLQSGNGVGEVLEAEP
ncbi:hypothetical protein ES332_A13G007400v1 [Gossypium tomentosum]|uniref:Uncharacterized protein n=1 Tax=Gossypium tomentosum TaxID=34277 RepID=A0A5D2ME86_GOSTO|nr:hypothetical protein ES332_A13G007400v1 [Gossypium tomentosum]